MGHGSRLGAILRALDEQTGAQDPRGVHRIMAWDSIPRPAPAGRLLSSGGGNAGIESKGGPKTPPTGFEPTTSRLLSGCSAN